MDSFHTSPLLNPCNFRMYSLFFPVPVTPTISSLPNTTYSIIQAHSRVRCRPSSSTILKQIVGLGNQTRTILKFMNESFIKFTEDMRQMMQLQTQGKRTMHTNLDTTIHKPKFFKEEDIIITIIIIIISIIIIIIISIIVIIISVIVIVITIDL